MRIVVLRDFGKIVKIVEVPSSLSEVSLRSQVAEYNETQRAAQNATHFAMVHHVDEDSLLGVVLQMLFEAQSKKT